MEEITDLETNVDHIGSPSSTTALMNPLILHKIFSFLDAGTLFKSARLVCSVWADVGAPFVGRKCGITLRTRSCVYKKSIKDVNHFNPQLARNVELVTGCTCRTSRTCRTDECTCLWTSFVGVLPQICSSLETLRLKLCNIRTSPCTEMWIGCTFPNLTHLEINVNGRNDPSMGRDVPNFGTLTRLRTLYFKEDMFSGESEVILQPLLNSAPNLEGFKYEGDFYPNLEISRKLKTMKYEYSSKHRGMKLNTFKLIGMHESCRDSVEKMTLTFSSARREQKQILIAFPKVTHLTVDADVYEIQYCLDNFHFPSLTHLSLRNLRISDFFKTFCQWHDAVRSIELKSDKEEHLVDSKDVDRVKNLFPALKELTLQLQRANNTYERHFFFDLTKTLKLFSDWKLARVKVVVIFGRVQRCGGPIIPVLEGIANWRGVQNTSIEFIKPVVARPNTELRDALLACRSLRGVTLKGIKLDAVEFESLRPEDHMVIAVGPDTIYLNPDELEESWSIILVACPRSEYPPEAFLLGDL